MGKMKMVRFSGIKFAAGLAYETLNPLPSHEIRRARIRRQIFSTDAKKKIVHFQIAGCKFQNYLSTFRIICRVPL